MERIKLAIERSRRQAQPPSAGTPAPHWDREQPAPPPDFGAPVDLIRLDPAHLEQHRIVALEQTNPLRRSFDLLRTQVLQQMDEHGWRTLAVTSPSTDSGKTVVAVNLALSIAHHPAKSALLIDLDLRRPNVANYLGLAARKSLNDVLEGGAQPADAIVHAGLPGFLVLPTRRKVAGAGEVLASERVGRIIGSLKDEHPGRITVLDLPPVAAVDDTIALLPRVDCVLLVIGSGSSTQREIEEAKRHLARYNLLGVVVNKVSEEPLQDGYY
jgi:capsular exopolysaccharide synthesis family protein